MSGVRDGIWQLDRLAAERISEQLRACGRVTQVYRLADCGENYCVIVSLSRTENYSIRSLVDESSFLREHGA